MGFNLRPDHGNETGITPGGVNGVRRDGLLVGIDTKTGDDGTSIEDLTNGLDKLGKVLGLQEGAGHDAATHLGVINRNATVQCIIAVEVARVLVTLVSYETC